MSNQQSLVDYLVEHEPSFRKARLPALYSDFTTLRTLNPDGYQANISAWRSALAHLARSGLAPAPKGSTPNLLVLNSDESLLRALESKKYGRPLALGTVIREALAAKDLMPLHDFLTSQTSIYYKPWLPLPSPLGIAGGVANWALKQLGVADWIRGNGLPKGQYVVVANVEEAGKQFAATTADSALTDSRFERTWSKAHFLQTYNEQVKLDQGAEAKLLTSTDLDVLLTFLSRDKDIILYDGSTFKIKAPSDSSPSGQQQVGITAEDTTVASIKELISSLTHQTHLLASRISDLDKTARAAVANKNRIAALAALKQKKLTEQTLEARYTSLTQLEAVAAKIQEATDSVAMMKVMETSSRVLESLNEQVGGVERVEDLTSRLREQMAEVDEVSTILAEAGTSQVVVDEEEVDEELEAMLEEETGKRQKEREREEEKREEERQREREQEREAEELRRRLEAIGGVPMAEPGRTEREREREVERLMKGMSIDD
ncbi:Snf7-domain-containing protein [Sordaria brevicollis]|uniref:Snf7-domain-containing protein n=1 Tax=Sordaria brevicollis TaxID=83679 RepID=A0AAE0PFB6_SORBR|nr:Snf7-domain-containing protein [Sordaria brevicollis]